MFNAATLPLNVSFRCARAIVKKARDYHDSIEAAPTAPEGSARDHERHAMDASDFRAGDMVLCRNNAPLICFAYWLLRHKVPLHVRGRDIGKRLIAQIDALKPEPKDTVADLRLKLDAWLEEQNRLLHQDDLDPHYTAKLERNVDVGESLKVFMRENVDDSIGSLRREINEFLNVKQDDAGRDSPILDKVVLSTIHKAKGLEAKKVFLLNRCLIGARLKFWSEEFAEYWKWYKEQEDNLMYVAITRAKEHLVYISDE